MGSCISFPGYLGMGLAENKVSRRVSEMVVEPSCMCSLEDQEEIDQGQS